MWKQDYASEYFWASEDELNTRRHRFVFFRKVNGEKALYDTRTKQLQIELDDTMLSDHREIRDEMSALSVLNRFYA